MSKIKDYAEQVYGEEYPDLTQGVDYELLQW